MTFLWALEMDCSSDRSGRGWLCQCSLKDRADEWHLNPSSLILQAESEALCKGNPQWFMTPASAHLHIIETQIDSLHTLASRRYLCKTHSGTLPAATIETALHCRPANGSQQLIIFGHQIYRNTDSFGRFSLFAIWHLIPSGSGDWFVGWTQQ